MLFISYSSKHFTCSSSFNAQNDLVVGTANTPISQMGKVSSRKGQ